MKENIKKQKGFTTTQIVVVTAIIVALVGITYFVVTNIYKPSTISEGIPTSHEEGTVVTQQLEQGPSQELKSQQEDQLKEQPEEQSQQPPQPSPTEKQPPPKEEEPPAEEGLVVYWSFDEGEGLVLGDSSGNSIDGEINGAAWVEGISNKALEFDGNDDFVEINDKGINEVGGLEYGTISLWFNFNKTVPEEILPILYLGENNSEGAVDNLIIEIGHFWHGFSPDKKIYYTLYNNNYEPILCFDSNQNLEEDTWYHYVVVNSPSGNTGYLNGVELTNRNYNFSGLTDIRFFSAISNKEIFRLGYGWFGIDQKFHYFRGILDELRIYNRILTKEEIGELANR